jgi:hypothetical protein
MKKFSDAAIYIMGILVMEEKEFNKELERLVDSVKDRRDYDAVDFKAVHSLIKEKTTRYVQILNEIDTLRKLDV